MMRQASNRAVELNGSHYPVPTHYSPPICSSTHVNHSSAGYGSIRAWILIRQQTDRTTEPPVFFVTENLLTQTRTRPLAEFLFGGFDPLPSLPFPLPLPFPFPFPSPPPLPSPVPLPSFPLTFP